MMRLVVTHISIGRESLLSSCVASQCVQHASLLLEMMLRAPETATGKYSHLYVSVGRRMIDVHL